MSLSELKPHLFSLPDYPNWIPYRTSYYKETWGFCLSHADLLNLQDDTYEVCIESSLLDGFLTYGEYFLQGPRSEEVLISCHLCHPSLCNDNLSGVSLAAVLAKYLRESSRKYSYRFLFIPATIGSITWLALNENRCANIKHGLVISNIGDAGPITYKTSRMGDAEIDKIATHVLTHNSEKHGVVKFSPYGYDERQYCSPGFNLPVGCLMRTPHGAFPEYHTSADNLNFVRPQHLGHSFSIVKLIIEALENNKIFMSLNPKCEPQLGKRGLYRMIGGQKEQPDWEMAVLWVLNFSDGTHTLCDIAEKSGLSLRLLHQVAERLVESHLIKECVRKAPLENKN